jgi:hypothetical protein
MHPVRLAPAAPLYTDIFNADAALFSGRYAIVINGHQTVCKLSLTTKDKIANFFKKISKRQSLWVPCYLSMRSSIETPTVDLQPVFIQKTPLFLPRRNVVYTPSRYTQVTRSLSSLSTRHIILTDLATLIQFTLHGPAARKIPQEHFIAALQALRRFNFKSMKLYRIDNIFVASWVEKTVLVFTNKIITGGLKTVYFVYRVTQTSEFSFRIKEATLKEPRMASKDHLDFTCHPALALLAGLENCRVGLYKSKNVKKTNAILPAGESRHEPLDKYYVCLGKQGMDVMIAMPRIRSLEQLTQIFVDVLTGLQQIHSVGCLHRDLKGENFIFYPKYTRIEDIDDIGPIIAHELSEMPCQTTRAMHLILRKKLMQNWDFECTADLSNTLYVTLWSEANTGLKPKIVYTESFEAERNVMGFALAEIYLAFISRIGLRDAKLEYMISRLLRYRLEMGEEGVAIPSSDGPFNQSTEMKPLFANFNSLLHAINRDIESKSLEACEDMVSHCIGLSEAICLL